MLTAHFNDGWSVRLFYGGERSGILSDALHLVEQEYGRRYHHIRDYLKREDDLMAEDKKLHFVLLDPKEQVQGHQLIYGDGASPVPSEQTQDFIDLRRGSNFIFEVKRAALLAKGRYWQLTAAIPKYFWAKHGGIENIPPEHTIVGYSIERTVVEYLCDHGYQIMAMRRHETWIRYATRDMARRYLTDTGSATGAESP